LIYKISFRAKISLISFFILHLFYIDI